ncbi:MAG: methylmalonyl-CoA mutase family protein, partial [Promethearchaeia archaeon]
MTESGKKDKIKPSPKERKEEFKNLSDIKIKRLYKPNDIENVNYAADLGEPGKYPFTRGAYRNMYRGRLWTMRQFAGFRT